jgi:hydrogenase maturation protein HypF
VKGIGGYHLACDADNAAAVSQLRMRKYRKEQAFAVMVRDIGIAEATAVLSDDARELLTSVARPIVLAPSRVVLDGVGPDNHDIGVMLPYAPVHHLLFASGAPVRLVMTSGNRSSEPIAYEDDDARARLRGLADAFLIGERAIARRVDDSVVRPGALGRAVLRRSRGLAPSAVAMLPSVDPILAVGGDLKNAITLVVDG